MKIPFKDKDPRERKREYALRNISGDLRNIAVAGIIHNQDIFGEVDDEVIDLFSYQEALNEGPMAADLETGEDYNVTVNALLASREDGERYSGQVTEKDIQRQAMAIFQESLPHVKVEDLAKLMGYKGKMDKNVKKSYVGDVEELGNQLTGFYMNYSVNESLSNAFNAQKEAVAGNLESILAPEEK